MAELYVADTNAIIAAFPRIFNRPLILSKKTLRLVLRAFHKDYSVRLSIPSVVFIELYDKWCRRPEASRAIYYEVFVTARESDVVEIRELDAEIVEIMTSFDDSIVNLESHDKIALAAAVALRAPLITSDRKIRRYVAMTNVIPAVLY